MMFFLIIKRLTIKKGRTKRKQAHEKGSLIRNTSRNETLRTIAKKERTPKGILERPASKGVRGKISYLRVQEKDHPDLFSKHKKIQEIQPVIVKG